MITKTETSKTLSFEYVDGFDRMLVEVDVNSRVGNLESNLIDNRDDAEHGTPYRGAIDGIESFFLSLACEDIDLSNPSIGVALRTALEKIDNFFG